MPVLKWCVDGRKSYVELKIGTVWFVDWRDGMRTHVRLSDGNIHENSVTLFYFDGVTDVQEMREKAEKRVAVMFPDEYLKAVLEQTETETEG